MSEEFIIKYCSPTLAGLKTGSLFSCSYRSEDEVLCFLRAWNNVLGKKGIRLFPLKLKDGKALIYVFRPKNLTRDFEDKDARKLLCERGYCTDNCAQCLARLSQRLGKTEDFPHEIGLFLGYPSEDVKGFIENKACCAKCVGCWKVYGDEDKAQKLFDKYKKCTKIYRKQWADGKPLEKLAVAK